MGRMLQKFMIFCCYDHYCVTQSYSWHTVFISLLFRAGTISAIYTLDLRTVSQCVTDWTDSHWDCLSLSGSWLCPCYSNTTAQSLVRAHLFIVLPWYLKFDGSFFQLNPFNKNFMAYEAFLLVVGQRNYNICTQFKVSWNSYDHHHH